jgi:hypothetical protein
METKTIQQRPLLNKRLIQLSVPDWKSRGQHITFTIYNLEIWQTSPLHVASPCSMFICVLVVPQGGQQHDAEGQAEQEALRDGPNTAAELRQAARPGETPPGKHSPGRRDSTLLPNGLYLFAVSGDVFGGHCILYIPESNPYLSPCALTDTGH